jgi:aminopeptidase N
MDRRRNSGHRRAWRVTAVLALAIAVSGAPGVAAAPGQPGTPRYTAGAEGAGDPYFPSIGNGGIDVRHYHLDITYTPPPVVVPQTPTSQLRGQFAGVATLDLVATQDLDRFNLDLRGMTVESITINGRPAAGIEPPAPGVEVEGAAWWRVEDPANRRWELTLQPRPKLKAGEAAQVVVSYGGETFRPTDIEGALYGWVTTRDGAMVANEPEGAMTWYPVSDHQTDKATYSFEITVPEGKVAVANGLPAGPPVTEDGWTTWSWAASDPMASYLSTASVGDYEVRPVYYSTSGVPIYDFLDAKQSTNQRNTSNNSLALQPAMIDFFESQFGPYPFEAYGSIVDNDSIGYALETQTRPIYSSQASQGTVAHELAHMWFGDSVSPARWADIWLNEGWATFSTWMWNDFRGTTPLATSFNNVYNRAPTSSTWAVPLADPGPLGLFSTAVYDRGAATLYALRQKVGDADFFAATHLWLERNEDATGSTDDFQAIFEEVSGQDLDDFFQVWVRQTGKPTSW